MIQPGIVRRHLRVRCSTVILASFEGGISECHKAFKNGEMVLNRPSALLVFRRVHVWLCRLIAFLWRRSDFTARSRAIEEHSRTILLNFTRACVFCHYVSSD